MSGSISKVVEKISACVCSVRPVSNVFEMRRRTLAVASFRPINAKLLARAVIVEKNDVVLVEVLVEVVHNSQLIVLVGQVVIVVAAVVAGPE